MTPEVRRLLTGVIDAGSILECCRSHEDLTFLIDVRCAEVWAALEQHPELEFLREPLWLLHYMAHAIRSLEEVESFDDYAHRCWRDPFLLSSALLALADNLHRGGAISGALNQRLLDWRSARDARLTAYNAFDAGHHWSIIEAEFLDGRPPPLPVARETSTLLIVGATLRGQATSEDASWVSPAWYGLEHAETQAWNLRVWERVTTGLQLRNKSSGEAEGWWVDAADLLPELVDSARRWLDADAGADREAITRALHSLAARSRSDALQAGHAVATTRAYHLTTISAAFSVITFVLRPRPRDALDALRRFGDLLRTSPWASSLRSPERAVTALRLALFYHQCLPMIGVRPSLIEPIVDALRASLADIEGRGHAGLARDLHLACARLIREVAMLRPGALDAAVAQFERGLDVDGARFDREARARGLSDYAGALSLRRRVEWRPASEIDRYYAEALNCLPADEFSSTRVTVLLNRAILWNEEPGHLGGQERALALLQDALELIRLEEREEARELPPGEAPVIPLQQSLRASVYLTYGNVLRSRRFGRVPRSKESGRPGPDEPPVGRDPAAFHAIRAYRSGLDHARRASDDRLVGLLHLAIGNAYLGDASEPHAGRLAMERFERAGERLGEYPPLAALATVGFAEAWLAARDVRGDTEANRVLKTLDEPARCLAEHRAHADAGRCATVRAHLHVYIAPRRRARLKRAVEAVERAIGWFRLAASIERQRFALLIAADLLWRWASTVANHPRREALLERAAEHLAMARALCEEVARDGTLIDRLDVLEDTLEIEADLTWLTVEVGTRPLDARALPRSPFAGARIGRALRSRGALVTERRLWAANGEAPLHTPLRSELAAYAEARTPDRAMVARGWLTGSRAAPTFSPRSRDASELRLALTVSRWGCLAVFLGPSQVERVIRLPFTRRDVGLWLWGDESDIGWVPACIERGRDRASKARWEEAFTRITDTLTEAVWRPIIAEWPGALSERRLLVAPGMLAGAPLHACLIDGDPLLARLGGWAYVGAAHSPIVESSLGAGDRALLVLSDPCTASAPHLPHAVHEVAALATAAARSDLRTTVVAASIGARGHTVFEHAGRSLPDEATVVDAHPTPRDVMRLLPGHALLAFVGHGMGETTGGGALILMNEDGSEAQLDLFTARLDGSLKPGAGVILSACETAWDGRGGAGMLSISATLLEQGAGFVLGSQWWVSDEVAPLVSLPFMKACLEGAEPDVAYARVVGEIARQGRAPRSRWGAFCLWLGQVPD